MHSHYGSMSLEFWSTDTTVGLIQVPSMLLDEAIDSWQCDE
jgi:hypothetical protein